MVQLPTRVLTIVASYIAIVLASSSYVCDSLYISATPCVFTVLQVMPNATLIVMTVMTDDIGQYQCQAVNLMGSSVDNVLVSYRGEAGVPLCVCMVRVHMGGGE